MQEIMNQMSIRDKVNQTMVILYKEKSKVDCTPGAAFFGGQIITQADETGIDELREFVNELYDNSEIPPLITSDFENGCGGMIKGLTAFPLMMGLGATADSELAYDYGKATALEARQVGANWTFSPVCDLNKNRRNPLVNNRALTDDENLACLMLPQIVRGMQDHGLCACAKHFPGDGVDYRDQHIITTENRMPMERWYETFGKVYRKLIEADLDSVMAGHITLPDYPQEYSAMNNMPFPATLNKALITDLLKGELGFEGVVVTDALNMGGFHGFFDTHEQAEIEAFKAGCDMLLWPSKNYAMNLEKAVLSGEVPMERLDDAVRRILRIKKKVGLFEKNHKRFYDLTQEDKAFIKDVQTRCAEKSITLLRDNLSHFPLNPEKTRNLGIVVLTEYEAYKSEAMALKKGFNKAGFNVSYFEGDQFKDEERDLFYRKNDLIIYAMFSRQFRPIGFLDFTNGRAWQIAKAFMPDGAINKTIFVSFGSPYFGDQYLEKAQTYVNAYSPFSCSAEGFVRAACGEIPFQGISPVKLEWY